MENNCARLHAWARTLKLHAFPFAQQEIPANGIYLLFERGEEAHDGPRITRAGTHTGNNQLPSRLRQHFVMENKDRSIFRKNIGRALLNKSHDSYLSAWELDLTARAAKERHAGSIDPECQRAVERQVTDYMQKNFTFVVISIEDKQERLDLESKIISTLSSCSECAPSKEWLGSHSPKAKIRTSGLWLINELYKEPLSQNDLARLASLH